MLFSPVQHYRWREAVLLDACLEITHFFSRVNKINESPCSTITATINVTLHSHKSLLHLFAFKPGITHTHTHMLRQTITHSAWWRTTSWYTFMETAYTHNIARVSMLLSLYTSQNEATCLQSVALNTMLPCPFTCSQFRLQHIALLKWTGQSLNWPIACHLIHTHEDPEVLIKLCTSLLWFFFYK